ncbi:MAG: enoyl-CoA hydratase/isomerase family protein [Pyrinomonadaceae bacterium]|nr:enoyl-CoA hydratase/isomerase family protein [Pyrinomonadaceae bacterium]
MEEKYPIDVKTISNAAVVRFNRPEIKNPLSIRTLQILSSELEAIESNSLIEVIVFTGSENTFAAGANLSEVAQLNEKTALEFGLRGQRLMERIHRSKKFTVAAIDGFCLGGGLDLAISCNSRVATPGSFFAHPGAKLGIITGWGGTQFLPRLIGRKRALEMFLTAERVDAATALEIGLIDELSTDPLAKALEKARQ